MTNAHLKKGSGGEVVMATDLTLNKDRLEDVRVGSWWVIVQFRMMEGKRGRVIAK